MLKQPVATYFKTNLKIAGTVFSYFMFGMLINEFLNGYLVKFIKVKQEIFLAGLIFVACVVSMFFISSIYMLGVLLFITGLCFGVLVHIPNTLIVHAFDKTIRSVKLNRLDLFFSIGSFVYPFIAGAMLTSLCSFQQVYLTVLIIVLFIFFMTCIVKLPNLDSSSNDSATAVQHFSKWNINVFLVFFVLVFYFLSYIAFTYWVVDYLVSVLKAHKVLSFRC